MDPDSFTPEQPQYDTLEKGDSDSPNYPRPTFSAEQEHYDRVWPSQAIFDCYND